MKKKYSLIYQVALSVVLSCFLGCQLRSQSNDSQLPIESVTPEEKQEKMNGVSFVSVGHEIDSSHVIPFEEVGANWVSVIPYAYMPNSDNSDLQYDTDWQWIGERIEGCKSSIQLMHQRGISVMLKPQVWVGHGIFTGKIEMKTEEAWKAFQKNYSSYILAFAKLAEEEGVALLCIGTEMNRFAAQRIDYWRELIKNVREVYSGKLTYAANWDDYSSIAFWDDLDFIGADAYFPIVDHEGASPEELKKGWEPHVAMIDSICTHFNRPILFTEYGYRSVANCAVKPWDYSNRDQKVDVNAQMLALEAMYETIWKKEYFAGGFLWKWHPEDDRVGGPENSMFTVQNKKSEAVVREYYSAN